MVCAVKKDSRKIICTEVLTFKNFLPVKSSEVHLTEVIQMRYGVDESYLTHCCYLASEWVGVSGGVSH